MAMDLVLPLRVVQALLALIVLGLTGWVAHEVADDRLITGSRSSPSQNSFLIFTSVWTFLALAYLLGSRFMTKIAHGIAILVVEVITMLFWFAGAIALAVFLGDSICRGRVCRALQAACVFAFFEWLLWVATLVLSALPAWRSRGVDAAKPTGTYNAGV
ncbi:MAG: hypothetical protein M1817_004492 [Caeruleum heppii]|nr:MAG: hypothetical protein M1817_004492 [Caeruleum heppii]